MHHVNPQLHFNNLDLSPAVLKLWLWSEKDLKTLSCVLDCTSDLQLEFQPLLMQETVDSELRRTGVQEHSRTGMNQI